MLLNKTLRLTLSILIISITGCNVATTPQATVPYPRRKVHPARRHIRRPRFHRQRKATALSIPDLARRAESAYQSGDLDQALADYTKIIELDPKNTDAYYSRAIVYEDKGNLDQAISDYTQVLALDAKYVRAVYNRGILYHKQGKLDQAIADYTKAMELDLTSPRPYNNRGLGVRGPRGVASAPSRITPRQSNSTRILPSRTLIVAHSTASKGEKAKPSPI